MEFAFSEFQVLRCMKEDNASLVPMSLGFFHIVWQIGAARILCYQNILNIVWPW